MGSELGTVQGAGNQDRGAAQRTSRRDERETSGFKAENREGGRAAEPGNTHVEEEEPVVRLWRD